MSEVLNATLASAVFASEYLRAYITLELCLLETEGSGQGGRSLTTSLKGAGYRSLGSLARNALFSNILESLCWPLEAVIDRSKL